MVRFICLSFILLVQACQPVPKYHNLVDTPYATGGSNAWSATWALFFQDDPKSFPDHELPIKKFHPSDLKGDFEAVWIGHATVLVKLGPYLVLTDPVFSERLSPVSWFGPKRFNKLPLNLDELPEIDAVVISHDHQDHLDAKTIEILKNKTKMFYVPLDVMQFLLDWGVPQEKITEMGWWQSKKQGDLEIICTPARHFSGRGIVAYNQTLWSSWVFKYKNRRAFFAGDTGLFPGFKEIGERLGPFDVSLMPIGAYDIYWAGIHMTPEEAVAAHKMLNAKLIIPIHWGTFDLSRHAWDEPIHRFKDEVLKEKIKFFIPLPGEIVHIKE